MNFQKNYSELKKKEYISLFACIENNFIQLIRENWGHNLIITKELTDLMLKICKYRYIKIYAYYLFY